MNLFKKKRFLTYLMTTIVILVTGSVTLISGALYIYIHIRLESEFSDKINAQKTQIGIILDNRITEVKGLLQSLSRDNTIRYTTKMENNSQLQERLGYFSSHNDSIYFYISKQNGQSILPKTLPNPFEGMDGGEYALPFNEKIIDNGETTRLIWQFDIPITDQEKLMGYAFALYDMTNDRQLIETIHRTIEGDILISKPNHLLSLIDGKSVTSTTNILNKKQSGADFFLLNRELVLASISGFDQLYFAISQEGLLTEKKRIFFLLGIFSISILLLSAALSAFLGKQMSRPLGEMAAMAIQISEGKKDLAFDIKNNGYLEFNQLSQAFNYMLANLKDAEEKSRFTELLENVDDAVYLTDENGKVLDANEATYRTLGYSPKTFFRMELSGILPEEDAKMVIDRLSNASGNSKSDKMTFETCHIKNDETLIPVEIKSRAITYRGKKAILNVARDMTQRKEDEKTLRQSEERYRSVVETSHDGILILDEQLRIIYANNKLCQILGYPRKDIEGSTFTTYLTGGNIQLENINDLRNLTHEYNQEPFNLNIIRKDKEERHCIINTATIEDSDEEIKTVVQLLDITDQFRAEQEKKLLESHLRQSQKMEAVGTLAGGIAHDFNNLLQIIHGYTEILLLKKKKDEPEYQKLNEVKQAALRATDLTKQLLTFSRKVESNMRPMDLNNEVVQIHKLLKRTIPQMIETDLRLSDTLSTINADTAQIGQMIMNLGVNARDAMPEGGKLTIETKNVTLDEKFCDTHLGAIPGNYVLLTISDTGEGIDKKSLEHIYEPFYTTKEIGKGTGLGLAIVYGIVNSHNGYIICESEINKGTSFKIYLPIIEQNQTSTSTKDEEIQMEGSETILVVDDDKNVRNVGNEMLSKVGYKIITASNGEKALDIFRREKEQIDLVMLDLMMPGMGGDKCLETLLEIDPDVKVLIASGHSMMNPTKNYLELGAKGFVNKPYEFKQILKAIRDVLNGS